MEGSAWKTRADAGTEKKGRSRVYSAVLSLVFPGLGQIVRGRIFAGLLFFLNVVLYFVPLFIAHNIEYRCTNALAADRNRNLDLFRSGCVSVPQFVPGARSPGIAAFLRERLFRGILHTSAFGYLK